MGKIITNVAFFEICKAHGTQGWIVLPDKTEFPIHNIEQGCELADLLVQEKVISPEECCEICHQIRTNVVEPFDFSNDLEIGVYGIILEDQRYLADDNPIGCHRN